MNDLEYLIMELMEEERLEINETFYSDENYCYFYIDENDIYCLVVDGEKIYNFEEIKKYTDGRPWK